MNKKLIAAIAATTMAGAIGFASVASAMEFSVYGSLRAGVFQKDTDSAYKSDYASEAVDKVDAVDAKNAVVTSDYNPGNKVARDAITVDVVSITGGAPNEELFVAIDAAATGTVDPSGGVIIPAKAAVKAVAAVAAGEVVNPNPTKSAGDKSTSAWDFGTFKAGSRFGVKGSEDLGNGLSAGFKIERGLGADGFTLRHQNAWLKGGWGTLTIGQQGNPYRNAANWDQSWWIGGANRYDDGGSRINGIRYDSNFDGPFSFSLMATAGDGDGAVEEKVILVNDAKGTTIDTDTNLRTTVTLPAIQDEDGIDSFVAAGHYNIGDVATVNLGFRVNNQEHNVPGESYDNTVISVNGVVGPFDWYVAYEENDDNFKRPSLSGGTDGSDGRSYVAKRFKAQDAETLGVFLSLKLGESDKVYFEYEDSSVDGADENLGGLDKDAILVGYSHKIGPSTSFIVEYASVDNESDFTADTDTLLAFLKVDF